MARAAMSAREATSDALQDAVGDFGRWQAGVSLLMALLKLPIAWFQLSIIVLEAHSDFWCARPSHLRANVTTEQWRNISQPRLSNGAYDACRIYDHNYTGFEVGPPENRSTVACQDWEYSRDIFQETIVTEWDLVCSQAVMTDIAQATFMSGVLIGNVVFGMAADRMGRKLPLMFAIGLQAVTGVLAAFSPWFYGFVVARFFMAVATGGTMIISFVLVMEIVGNQWRTTIAILYQIPFSLGMCMMSAVAYLQRDWRDFQFTLSAISALFLLYWWFIPESPRWLLAVGREKAALRILENAARWNGRDVTAVKKVLQHDVSDEEPTPAGKAGFADLLRTPNLRHNSLSLFFCWFVAGLVFFGFSQTLGRVGGDIFLTTVIAGMIGVPGTMACIYVVKFGRRKCICSSQIVTGVACLLLIVIPKGMFPGDWPRVLLSATTLTGMCLSFPALYVFSGELFPTVVRNVGLGSASMFSRLGSVFAPFVKSLDAFGHFWPPLIFGCASLIGAIVVAFLPETRNCRLPDTLEDGEKFTQKCTKELENGNYIQVSQQPAYKD
ncbi:organic cation transporter protein-like isoform X1 [Periplaneta americana]|uniref:organic cation transporter protein-like isoform X1 n=2 Tax=Periplaneta americana TaxID=6978 RepID=UPI0037E8D3ED